MEKQRIQILFDKYILGQCTPTELEELVTLLQAQDAEEVLTPELQQIWDRVREQGIAYPVDWEMMWQRIRKTQAGKVKRLIPWKRWAIAASLILVVATAVIVVLRKENGTGKNDVVSSYPNQDIQPPQSTKALLTLADGRTIAIDSLTTITQNGVTLIKDAEGKIIYNSSQPSTLNSQLSYNTLTNPRGSKVIDMTLADGSRVWLNAGSSISYPIAFTGKERKVFISGEAYFEITHNATKPFIVNANNKGEIEVLGTHFNVNVYDDEDAMRTTLLEGRVKVTRTTLSIPMPGSRILLPGEQAVLRQAQDEKEIKVLKDVNLDEVMAWKNGKFYFENSNIESIMKQLERWYDVEVVYQDKIPHLFVAKIPRDVPVSELLKLLELTNRVHFKVEGKKVIVMR